MTTKKTDTPALPPDTVEGEAEVLVPAVTEATKGQEVALVSAAEKGIIALKKKYGKLSIAGIEDKDGYKKVHAAWSEVRAKRLAIEKLRKEIVGKYNDITKGVNTEAGRLTDLISPLEKQLGDDLDRIDNEAKRLKQEQAEAEAKKQADRIALLTKNGMQFGHEGGYYFIGETITVDPITLRTMPDDLFDNLLAAVTKENEAILEAVRVAEERRKEDVRKLNEQRDEQEKERQRLQKEKDDLERERQNMRRETRSIRNSAMESLGFRYVQTGNYWEHGTAPHIHRLPMPREGNEKLITDLADLPSEIWANYIILANNGATENAKAIKDHNDKLEAERTRTTRRKEELATIGYKTQPSGAMTFTSRHGLKGKTATIEHAEIVKLNDGEDWDALVARAVDMTNDIKSFDLNEDERLKVEERAMKSEEEQIAIWARDVADNFPCPVTHPKNKELANHINHLKDALGDLLAACGVNLEF